MRSSVEGKYDCARDRERLAPSCACTYERLRNEPKVERPREFIPLQIVRAGQFFAKRPSQVHVGSLYVRARDTQTYFLYSRAYLPHNRPREIARSLFDPASCNDLRDFEDAERNSLEAPRVPTSVSFTRRTVPPPPRRVRREALVPRRLSPHLAQIGRRSFAEIQPSRLTKVSEKAHVAWTWPP